jgi:hypothetical protein
MYFQSWFMTANISRFMQTTLVFEEIIVASVLDPGQIDSIYFNLSSAVPRTLLQHMTSGYTS